MGMLEAAQLSMDGDGSPGFCSSWPWISLESGIPDPRKGVREPHTCGYSWGCSLWAGELENIFPA